MFEIEVGDIVEWEWSTPASVSGVEYRIYEVSNAGFVTPMEGGFASQSDASANGTISSCFDHFKQRF